jgi:hypothetical protein
VRRSIVIVASALALASGLGLDLRAQAPVPVREVREEMRIVSNDAVPAMQLTTIRVATVLGDGRILTSHSMEGRVRVFAPNGTLIRVLGRPGSGPGEFRSPSYMGHIGDTIWVRDDTHRAYMLFGPDYAPLSKLKIPGSGLLYGLISSSASLYQPIGDSANVSVLDPDGKVVRTLDVRFRQSVPPYEVPRAALPADAVTENVSTVRFPQPLTSFTSFALLPGGREASVLESAAIWGGQPGQLAIQRVTIPGGRIAAPVTVSLPARQISRSEADSIIDAEIRDHRLARAVRGQIKVPSWHIAFASIVPTSDGVLWIQDRVDRTSRLVVDLAGKPLMRVRLPAGLRVFGATRTHVWGILYDADDLPIIVRYRVV